MTLRTFAPSYAFWESAAHQRVLTAPEVRP